MINAWTLIALGATVAVIRRVVCEGGRRRKARPGAADTSCRRSACNTPARSFAEMIAEHLLPRFLRPRTTRQAPRGLFPSASEFGSECPDPISDKVYEPFFRRWAERFSRLRILQQGKVHVYLVYIVLMVVLALAWVSVREVMGCVMSESLVLSGIDRRRLERSARPALRARTR